jgi:hypothetical protein
MHTPRVSLVNGCECHDSRCLAAAPGWVLAPRRGGSRQEEDVINQDPLSSQKVDRRKKHLSNIVAKRTRQDKEKDEEEEGQGY